MCQGPWFHSNLEWEVGGGSFLNPNLNLDKGGVGHWKKIRRSFQEQRTVLIQGHIFRTVNCVLVPEAVQDVLSTDEKETFCRVLVTGSLECHAKKLGTFSAF